MRTRAGLAAAILLVGCGGSDDAQTPIDSGVDDAGTLEDTLDGSTLVDSTTEDTATGAESGSTDSAVPDSVSADTATADTAVADSRATDSGADTTTTEVAVDVGTDSATDTSATLSCTSCHGDAVRSDPAPPRGTKGETATSTRAVGAHQSHLRTSTWHRDVACTECHVVPTSLSHSNGTVDITWGALAKTGTTPSYASSTMTCAGVYCHGVTLRGANTGGTVNRTPLWTTVDGTYDACGSTCHTNPPGGGHPNNTGCPGCHSPTIATYDPGTRAATWVNGALHINGVVDR